MKQIERKIIDKCATALCSLPGQNNAMSSRGAAQYSEEMKRAIGLNNRAIQNLLDGDFETADRFANDLVALVMSILMREGLTVTAAMQSLRE